MTHTVLLALPRPCFPLITVGSHTSCNSHGSALTQCSIHHIHTMPSCGRVGGQAPVLQAYMRYGERKYNMQCVYAVAGVVDMPLGVRFRGARQIKAFTQVRSRTKLSFWPPFLWRKNTLVSLDTMIPFLTLVLCKLFLLWLLQEAISGLWCGKRDWYQLHEARMKWCIVHFDQGYQGLNCCVV